MAVIYAWASSQLSGLRELAIYLPRTCSNASLFSSQENSEPNGKCCMTGNFDKTSALNILIMPLLIFPHPSLIPEMSNSIGLCSQNGPFFTSLMNATAEKYMLTCLILSTMLAFVTSLGFGAPLTEPSVGMGSTSLLIGRVSCAEPKMYGMNEWSSKPHTPCDPAGSRVYVVISCLTISRYLKQ
ncbi:hypothetical protein HDV57DRAFT_267730 [Trichoderma longibrachiatum]